MSIINYLLRGKIVIKNKLVFGGGHPKFSLIPRIVKWDYCLSIFWLGTELVWISK